VQSIPEIVSPDAAPPCVDAYGGESSIGAQVRADLASLAELLRDAAGELSEVHRPAVEDAAIGDWVSFARLTYDLARAGIDGMLDAAALACGTVASQYDLVQPFVVSLEDIANALTEPKAVPQ
jgi:hypothetical protein